MSRTAAAGLFASLVMGWTISPALAQTAPTPPATLTRPQSTPAPTLSPQVSTQPRDPNRPNHWFYDMLDKSDAGRLTGKKTGRRPQQVN